MKEKELIQWICKCGRRVGIMVEHYTWDLVFHPWKYYPCEHKAVATNEVSEQAN